MLVDNPSYSEFYAADRWTVKNLYAITDQSEGPIDAFEEPKELVVVTSCRPDYASTGKNRALANEICIEKAILAHVYWNRMPPVLALRLVRSFQVSDSESKHSDIRTLSKYCDRLSNGVNVIKDHVVIDGKNKLALRASEPFVASSRNGIYCSPNKTHRTAEFLLDHFRGSVGGNIVNNYDLDVGPLQSESMAQRLSEQVFIVVRKDHYGNSVIHFNSRHNSWLLSEDSSAFSHSRLS